MLLYMLCAFVTQSL